MTESLNQSSEKLQQKIENLEQETPNGTHSNKLQQANEQSSQSQKQDFETLPERIKKSEPPTKREKLQTKGKAGIPSLFINKPKIEKLDIFTNKTRAFDFLEKLKQANTDLDLNIRNGLNSNIEDLSSDDNEHIEMQLDLGVFDIQIPTDDIKENINNSGADFIQEL